MSDVPCTFQDSDVRWRRRCGEPARWRYRGFQAGPVYLCERHAEVARRLVRLYPRLCTLEPLEADRQG